MSFGEFESKFLKAKVPEPLEQFYALLSNFHPKTRPVLWRILVTQAHIYKALEEIQHMKLDDIGSSVRPSQVIIEIKSAEFDWHKDKEETSIDTTPFEAVEHYLRECCGNLIDIQRKPTRLDFPGLLLFLN